MSPNGNIRKKINFKTVVINIGIGIILLLFFWTLYEGIFISHVVGPSKLKKESRYSITSSIELQNAARPITFRYSFRVHGKTYSGTSTIINSEHHYFIKFYPPNPKYNKATEILATQEDIDSLPADG